MLIRVRCPKNPDGYHVWHRRIKREYGIINNRTIVGYTCNCGARQYIDLE